MTTSIYRRFTIQFVFVMLASALVMRLVYVQLNDKEFLRNQGEARHIRDVTITANRGVITDVNGEPLAISTPVDSVWINPKVFTASDAHLNKLSKAVNVSVENILNILEAKKGKEFAYLRRHAHPDVIEAVKYERIPGVDFLREYRRYYPAGEVFSHVVGFTNIDDIGQEGVELAYDNLLRGTPGKKRVLKDRLGRVIDDIESIDIAKPGQDLTLSLDRRIQYLAYRELKAAVLKHNAESGSLVMLNSATGEIIAMVNQPSYNPNDRRKIKISHLRNRAATDVYEPGSTIKPFIVASALKSKVFSSESAIDTTPGYMRVGKHLVRDVRNFGQISIKDVLVKSSNVGISKISLSLESKQVWSALNHVGFGSLTNSGFPGERYGQLPHYERWGDIEQATISFGYGVSTTPLQLANAYNVLARDGVGTSLTLTPRDTDEKTEQFIDKSIAKSIRKMLVGVTLPGGTARLANIPGYSVAGKTGTVKKSKAGAYSEDDYLSLFAGIVPAKYPKLVAVVVINSPKEGEYYGGLVAAPIFSRVMQGALRILGVSPVYSTNAQLSVSSGGDV